MKQCESQEDLKRDDKPYILVTLLNCRCYDDEDELRTDSVKNRACIAFNDPSKSGGIIFEASGSSSTLRLEAKWCSSNQGSNLAMKLHYTFQMAF